MELSRREFVWTAAATAALGLPAAEDAKPILRIGAMSDNHLHPDRPATHRRTKACFDHFRRLNADIVVDTGDIADRSHVTELQFFRRCFDDAFAGTDCVPFFCIANHDYNYVPNTRANDPKNIENAWRALKMGGPNPTAVVKGYRFVNVFQNEPRRGAFAEAVSRAVAASEAGRPVFVVNHVPPMHTTTGTEHWSSEDVRKVLNRYPQVVALTGHIHTAISWAANVWQGEFTSVSLGAHAEYSNKIDGEATVLDVFADRIDIRRYEATSGREIGADDRWSIPLPLDPAHGPYRADRRAKSCPVPALPATATLEHRQSRLGDGGAIVFTSAVPRNVARHYRITLESQGTDGDWRFLGTLNWAAPQVMDEPGAWKCPVLPALLDAGRPHRATIVPVNSLGVAGAGRTLGFDVPPNPMTRLPAALTSVARWQTSFTPGEGVFAPGADGWFEKRTWASVIVLPKALTATLKGKKAATLVFDIGSEQTKGRPNTFSLARFPSGGGPLELGFGERFYTLPGTYATHRYAWSVSPRRLTNPDDEICLVIREGGDSRYRVNDVRCFVCN